MTLLRLQKRHFPRANVGTLLMLLLTCVSTRTANASTTKTQHSGTEIVFGAQLQMNDELWRVLFQSLRVDLAAGSDESPKVVVLDRNPALIFHKDLAPETSFGFVLQVKLLGSCDVASAGYYPFPNGPLGWVKMVSGHTQPLISINCIRLAQLLGPEACNLDKQRRRRATAQALAHVLIHEWIHIATPRPSHHVHGIMKSSISVKELTAESAIRVGRLEAEHRDQTSGITRIRINSHQLFTASSQDACCPEIRLLVFAACRDPSRSHCPSESCCLYCPHDTSVKHKRFTTQIGRAHV